MPRKMHDIKATKEATKAINTPMISTSKVAKSIRSDSLRAIQILTKDYLHKVRMGKVHIQSTKELKDLNEIFTNITAGEQNENKDAPQVNADAVNFYGKVFREPKDTQNINAGINDKLKNMNPHQVSELMRKQERATNNENAKNV